jgi:sugar (glycoside-pentoside-hexuronide) transporter
MEKVSGFEKFSYSMGAFGQNFAYAIMMSYLMIFYTDNVGISSALVGTLFLVARLWDAVNDPLTGFIIDRVNLKSGKYRPFIGIGGVLIGVLTILCFINPNFDQAGKVVYAFVTYILWCSVYSIMDIPYWSMAPSMTSDPAERTKVISIPKIMATIGSLLVAILTIPLVGTLGGGSNSTGYFWTAVIYGVICAGGALMAAINTKERIKVVKKPNEKFKDSIDLIIKNRPLLMILLVTFFTGTTITIKQTVATYYFTYNVGDVNLVPLFALAGLIPMVAAMVISPPISKKYGKKATAMASGIVGAVFSAAIYYANGNLPLVFAFNAISMVGIGVMLVMTLSMQADTVEYGEWKTGKRSESIIFSMGTFMTLLSSAAGGAIAGFWLQGSGYVANAVQTGSALEAIILMLSWAPAIGLVLMDVFLIFYNLSEKRHAEILRELEERKMENPEPESAKIDAQAGIIAE